MSSKTIKLSLKKFSLFYKVVNKDTFNASICSFNSSFVFLILIFPCLSCTIVSVFFFGSSLANRPLGDWVGNFLIFTDFFRRTLPQKRCKKN